MSFLINPFIYERSPAITNIYSMKLTAASSEKLYINNKSNAIDTALRDVTPNVSISFWFKTTVANGIIFSKYHGTTDKNIYIQMNNSRLQILTTYDNNNLSNNLYTNNTYADGVWHHVVFVYDSSQAVNTNISKVYIDGALYSNWNVFL